MIEGLFYPALTRRDKYLGGAIGGADYKVYHDEVTEDCDYRCVYCDIQLDEHGFEGMHLDHFRPQKHFPKLSSDPMNLVLSCPKCNRSKWYHWPCDTTVGSPSHNGTVGFVDPFEEDRKKYLSVNASGALSPVGGPGQYIIDLLKLNRKARVQVRRRRILRTEIANISADCNKRLTKLLGLLKAGEIKIEEAIERLEHLQVIISKLQELHNKVSKEDRQL